MKRCRRHLERLRRCLEALPEALEVVPVALGVVPVVPTDLGFFWGRGIRGVERSSGGVIRLRIFLNLDELPVGWTVPVEEPKGLGRFEWATAVNRALRSGST